MQWSQIMLDELTVAVVLATILESLDFEEEELSKDNYPARAEVARAAAKLPCGKVGW